MPNVNPVLLNLILTQLAPLFLKAAANDPAAARQAALETIGQYQIRTSADLLLAAQVVAFSLAAIQVSIDTLQPDLPEDRRARLRKTAAELSRTAERNRKALEPPAPRPTRSRGAPKPQPATEAKSATEAQTVSEERPAPETQPESIVASPQADDWMAAFSDVAQEFNDRMPGLNPSGQHKAGIQAAALQEAAALIHAGPSARSP